MEAANAQHLDVAGVSHLVTQKSVKSCAWRMDYWRRWPTAKQQATTTPLHHMHEIKCIATIVATMLFIYIYIYMSATVPQQGLAFWWSRLLKLIIFDDPHVSVRVAKIYIRTCLILIFWCLKFLRVTDIKMKHDQHHAFSPINVVLNCQFKSALKTDGIVINKIAQFKININKTKTTMYSIV